MLRTCQNRLALVRVIVYLGGKQTRIWKRKCKRSQTAIKALYLYPLSSKWSSNSEHSCSWMSNLLNSSAHLKSTAKDLKPDAGTVCLWSQGYPHQWCNVENETFNYFWLFPWGSRSAVAVNVVPFQRHHRAFVTLHACVFSSAAIISAGGRPLFHLLPSPTGLLNLKAAGSSILLSTSLCPVLLSKLQQPPSCSTFIYKLLIWRQVPSLSQVYTWN